MTAIIANGQEMEIEMGPSGVNVIVSEQGIRVDVPGSVEINARVTLDCMKEMSQKAWEHISTGPLFRELFEKLFGDCGLTIPATIEELNAGDFGVIHGCGLIVLGCEAYFANATKIYFRTPEDMLHPKATRCIMTMLYRMREILGGGKGPLESVMDEINPEKPA